jgi:uncharacterized protein
MTRALAALLVALALASPASALTQEDYGAVNAAIAEGHGIPRYATLAETAAAFSVAAAEVCVAPDAQGVERLREAWRGAEIAWQSVEHLRFGPVELFLRASRIAFWPDQGRAQQQTAELLAAPDPAMLDVAGLSKASVAIQGLPAAEVLLFDEGAAEALAAGDESARYRCGLLVAIGANLAQMTRDTLAEWQDGEGSYARRLQAPGPDDALFRVPGDVTLELFESLHNELQLVLDAKLMPVVGKDAGSVRPRLEEGMLSGGAIPAIVANLEAVQALYLGENGAGLSTLVQKEEEADPGLDALMRKAFDKTLETARGIEGPLAAAAADPARREAVDKLVRQVQALKEIVKTRLAAALGFSVGFNALDGD